MILFRVQNNEENISMNTEQALRQVIDVDRANIELETKIEGLKDKIERNHKRIVEYFFPFLLSAYEKWRPRIDEKAMFIDFVSHICFEVTVKHIDGNSLNDRVENLRYESETVDTKQLILKLTRVPYGTT